VIDIGSRLEPFVDEYLVEGMQGLALRLHHPCPREVALRLDAPWEGLCSHYVTVFHDGALFRMYYRGWPDDSGYGTEDSTCLAFSDNGIRWEKPNLGIWDFHGSKENNIVWRGEGAHNFAPFLDGNPAASEDARYKAVAGAPLIAVASADGMRWRKIREEPILTEGAFDSQNTAFWDSEQGQYVCYFREWREEVRHIRRSTSPDFINWSAPEWVDFGAAPVEHLYTNSITPYFRAPHIRLGFPMRFAPGRKVMQDWPNDGLCDGVFMSSRDGLHWERRFMEAFLRPGLEPQNWTDRNNHIAWGVVPTGPEEISVYYLQHYQHPSIYIRRGALRTDGFVSVNAPYAGGELLTKLFIFAGGSLRLNYSTSAAGSIRVEVRDDTGSPLAGLSLDRCDEMFGDEIERVVSWGGKSDLSGLVGRPVRLRFAMRDADLYSLRFV